MNALARRVLASYAVLILVGCAYNQSIDLAQGSALQSPASITFDDRRSEPDRKTRINPDEGCARWYGDTFIAPSKQALLRHLLATRASAESALAVVLERFDTVEYCGQSAARVAALAQAAAAAAVTGSTAYYDVPTIPGGDVFVLRVAGSINGKPFDISKGFNYGDVTFSNFPSESPIYRQRVSEVFNAAVDAMLAIAAKQK